MCVQICIKLLIPAPKSRLENICRIFMIGQVSPYNLIYHISETHAQLRNITETEAINCTITGISNFCLAHHFHLLQQQLNKYPMISSSCYRNWLDENFPPPLTSDAVLKSISCRVQDGDYCCWDPALELDNWRSLCWFASRANFGALMLLSHFVRHLITFSAWCSTSS